MGKLVPVLLSGTGAAVVSTGGMYVLNGSFFSEEEVFSRELSFKDLDAFKKEHGGECVQKYFKDLNYGNLGQAIDGNNVVSSTDFPTTASEGSNLKSCLVVNWERTDSDTSVDEGNRKWKGNFRLLWSFINGDKGLVMFYATKESEIDKQLDLDAGIYFVSNEDTSGNKTWKVKKYKEVSGTSKPLNTGEFDKLFPKNSDNFVGLDESHKNNWGFVKGGDDLDKVCGKNTQDCPKNPKSDKSSFKEVWKWQTGSKEPKNTPSGWSSSLHGNLTNLLGTAGLSHMSNAFDNFQGLWEKQVSSKDR